MSSSQIDFLLHRFRENSGKDAVIWRDHVYTYQWLLDAIHSWREHPEFSRIPDESTVSLEADYSPQTVALLLALLEKNCIIALMSAASPERNYRLLNCAEVEHRIRISEYDSVDFHSTGFRAEHPLYSEFRKELRPGLVLFTSGSSGRFKAALHDAGRLLRKFHTLRNAYRTMAFLLFDHIGGLNTLLYALSNGGCLVTVQSRQPEDVLASIEKHSVQLLPTTPTFLNLLLHSEAFKQYSLPTLERMTYGTEPMSQFMLTRFHEIYPHVKIQQTYGLTEVGILRSKSLADDSLWVKIGGEDYQTRVVNGLLEIKTDNAMIGYLNAPSPFTEDGWFKTGDAVAVNGEYLCILGRLIEIIRVGEENVFPTDVESVIQSFDNIEDALVYGADHPVTGQAICAKIKTQKPVNTHEFALQLLQYCQEKLPPHKVPVRFEFVEENFIAERFKKQRTGNTPAPLAVELTEKA